MDSVWDANVPSTNRAYDVSTEIKALTTTTVLMQLSNNDGLSPSQLTTDV